MVPAARLFRAAGRVSSDSSGAGVRLAAAAGANVPLAGVKADARARVRMERQVGIHFWSPTTKIRLAVINAFKAEAALAGEISYRQAP